VRLVGENGEVLPKVEAIMRMATEKRVGIGFGQVLHVNSIDGMRIFVRGLLGFGIQPDAVKKMLQDSPATLMYLDDDLEQRVPPTRGYGNSVRRGEIGWDTAGEN
jgi:hypothetical protein